MHPHSKQESEMADGQDQVALDRDNLYREETISDQSVGSIRCLHPIQSDGSEDPSRAVRYMGSTQVMTPMGALPLTFELEAGDLQEALDQFPDAAQRALEDMEQELREMQREQAGSIVTPGQGGGMGGGLGGAGSPGGGLGLR
jgi:hypothetical protein